MQKIRIKIKGFDAKLVDTAVKQIIEDVVKSGAKIAGPVPIPNKRRLITVLQSPHIDAKAKEHFEIITHARVIDILDSNAKTIESLTYLQVPSGVSIEIK
ncbi:MAG: 30S ribosomal protein S10 [bacterium]